MEAEYLNEVFIYDKNYKRVWHRPPRNAASTSFLIIGNVLYEEHFGVKRYMKIHLEQIESVEKKKSSLSKKSVGIS